MQHAYAAELRQEDADDGADIDMSNWILGTSIVLQLAASVMALRLMRVTGFLMAWLLIASALALMALRRSITFYQSVAGQTSQPINVAAEITALAISALMLAGIYLIRPYFISNQKSHKSLEKSRASYRDILENMTDVFYRTDNEGRLTMVSASVSELLGYAPDEVIGMHLDNFYVNVREREDFLSELRVSGRVTGYETALVRKDGSHVPVETNSRVVTDDYGNEIGVEGLARDITLRKQTDQLNTRLGRIVEDSTNEIYVFDSETLRFVQVNRGARENLGFTSDEVSKLTPVSIKPEFDEAEFRHLIQPLRGGSVGLLQFETVHERKDGSTYPVDVRLQLARSETPPVFFAIIQDISDRKRTERELVRSQKLTAVGQLTGGIAHDFNNLLTVILGNIELALNEVKPTDPRRGFLDASLHAARSGAALIQRLLAFSRRQPLKPTIVDIGELIEEFWPLVVRGLREDIEAETEIGAGTWPCEIDVSQLENVLLNLTINANDAMPGGGKLEVRTENVSIDDEFVSTHPEAASGFYVHLSVSDSGHGMSREILEQAFEPFFTTKNERDGTGLGLSMVYGFVKQSGGFVVIESQVDKGTTVNVYLPAIPGHIGHVVKSREADPDDEPPKGTGVCVLIVEDNENLLGLTVRMLGKLQYETVAALNANAAIEILESRDDIDVLLSDIILRGSMDGLELGEIVRRRWPGLKVLYMSGFSDAALKHEERFKPGVDLLVKPFTSIQLARLVHKAASAGRADSV